MSNDSSVLYCPLCKTEIDKSSGEVSRLLFSYILSDMYPEIGHDQRQYLGTIANAVYFLRLYLPRSGVDDPKIVKFLDVITEETKRLASITDLHLLVRPQGIEPLENIIESVKVICVVCQFEERIDFGILNTSDKKIDSGLFMCTFLLALRGSLISLGRISKPSLEISFDIADERLITKFIFNGDLSINQSARMFDQLNYLVCRSGTIEGNMSLAEGAMNTLVWDVPLIGGG